MLEQKEVLYPICWKESQLTVTAMMDPTAQTPHTAAAMSQTRRCFFMLRLNNLRHSATTEILVKARVKKKRTLVPMVN